MKKILIAVCSIMVAGCGIMDRIRGDDDDLEPLKPNPLPAITQKVSVERACTV